MVFAALLWSLDGFIRYPASHNFHIHQLVFFEHLVGFLIIFPFFLIYSRHEFKRFKFKHFIGFLLIAAIGSLLGNALYTKAIQNIGPATGTLFQVLQPLGVIGLAALFLKEKTAAKYFPFAIWILLNAFLIAYPDVTLGFKGEDSHWTSGVFFGFGAVVAWAISTICGKWLTPYFSSIFIVTLRWFTALFLMGIYTFFISDVPIPYASFYEPDFMSKLFGLSALPGVLAFYFYYKGLKNLPVSIVTFIEVLYPIAGIFLPLIISSVPISTIQIFGASTILLSIIMIVLFELREND